MGFKLNRIKADLKAYPPYLIMGESKVGKSTLFRDLVLYNYKTPTKGLLLSIADENGYYALDQFTGRRCKSLGCRIGRRNRRKRFCSNSR